jgi:hypothetical protein
MMVNVAAALPATTWTFGLFNFIHGEMYRSRIDFEGRHGSKEIDSGTFGILKKVQEVLRSSSG